MGANSMTGFDSKRDMAADKVQEDLINYGTAWSQDGKRIDPMSVYKEPAQEPVVQPAPGYCKNCKDYTIEEPLYAQPAQEPVCPACKAEVLYECVACSNNNYPPQPAQEPVAWRYRGNLHEFDPSDWATGPVTPLYTTPPQRPWVELTDEKIALIDWESLVTKKDCVQAVEAKLKEKNT